MRGKTGWREVEIGRGVVRRHLPGRRPADLAETGAYCAWPPLPPGPRAGQSGGSRAAERSEAARLVKRAALAAGVCGDVSEAEREQKFFGHSLRAGLASSTEVDERYVQISLATQAPR